MQVGDIMSNKIDERASDIRWLEQQADVLQMILKENVNIAESQAQLSIPLLDWPLSTSLPLSLSAAYSSSSNTPKNGLLGSGWSLNHPMDFIIVDYKGGVFRETFEYILMINNQLEQLIPIHNSTQKEGLMKFRLGNTNSTDTKIDITYDEPYDRWSIETKNILTVFGRSRNPAVVGDAVQESLQWENWRGLGYSNDSLDSLEGMVIAWYIISREEKHGFKTKLLYDYQIETALLPNGKSYTNLVELKCIRTESRDTDNSMRLEFHYGEKGKNEYHVQSPVDSNGHYRFPLFLQSKLFFEGYTFQTGKNFRQQIQLEYETRGEVRLLKNISQLFNSNHTESLLSFFYGEFKEREKTRHLMSEVRLGVNEQNSIKYFYKQLQIPLLDFGEANTRTYLTTQNMQLKVGENFSVIAHIFGEMVVIIDILSREFTDSNSIAHLEIDVHIENEIAGEKINEYEVIPYPNLLGVLVTTTTDEESKAGRQFLFIFHCKDGKWTETPDLFGPYVKKELFRYSGDIMLLAQQTGEIQIFEPDENSEKGYSKHTVSANSNSIRRCVIQDTIVVVFDGHSLFTITKDQVDGKWKNNYDIAAVTSKELEFETDVSMDPLMADFINQHITKFGLQMYKNMILFSELVWENNFYACKANLYLLDKDFYSFKYGKYIAGGDLANKSILEYKRVEEEDGSILTLGYKQIGSQYVVQLVEISGDSVNEAIEICKDLYNGPCPDNEIEKIHKQIIDGVNEQQDYVFRKLILFDPAPCLSYTLDSSGVATNSSIIHMQGDSWAQEWVEKRTNVSSIALQSIFVLESSQNKTVTDFKLFTQNPENGDKQGEALETFSIKLNGTVAIGYPSYIAYQTSEVDPIVIIPIVGNGTGVKIEVSGQQLLGMSTSDTLLTYQRFDDPNLYPKNTRVLARRINSFISSQPFHVIARCEVSTENGDNVRFTGYENEFISNITKFQQENTVRITPSLSSTYSGTYEEVTIIPMDSSANITKTQRWLDSEGVLIRSKVVDYSKHINVNSPPDEIHSLLDLSGNLQISDIFPYNLTQNMVAYYGFEKYENSSLFGKSLLFSNENLVVENGDSLTGQSLLRLDEGQKLILSLCPSDQFRSYTASCWIRPKQASGVVSFEYDLPIPYFRANLGFKLEELDVITPFLTFYGQMKRQKDNWLYLEVTTDLDKIRNNVYPEYYRQNEDSEVVSRLLSVVATNFTISIEVEPLHEMQIDVDHIRFLPTGSDLSMKVYNGEKGQEIETILENGAIKRKLYHEISGDEIAELDENGEVEMFHSGSKSGSIFTGDSNNTIGTGMKSELFLIPKTGSFERFNLFHFDSGRWETNDLSHWEMNGRGNLAHKEIIEVTELKVGNPKTMFGDGSLSTALSFYFRFSSDINVEAIEILLGDRYKLIDIKSVASTLSCNLSIFGSSTVTQALPCHGQLVFMTENETMWVWFDGLLIYEGKIGLTNPWSNLVINVRGQVAFSNMLVLNEPQVMLTYFNAFGQKIQMLKLISEKEILISEVIYDEMGRESIKTKAGRLSGNGSEPILKYYADFVSNRNPVHSNSIFRTGVAEGRLAEMYPEDKGYSYGRTYYMNDLTGEVSIKGYPGKEYLKGGKFVKEYSRISNILLLDDLFPPDEGFTLKVLTEPNSNVKVTIFDSRGREVGDYIQVPGYSHILTTYDYDDNGNILKILPPNYHHQINSFERKLALSKGEKTSEERYWAEQFGSFFTYNEANQMTSKTTPDIGRKEYLYDMLGNLRFFYSVKNNGAIDIAKDIIYLLHSGSNKPVEIGYIEGELPVEQLYQFKNTTEVPNSYKHVYQRIIYSDLHSDPNIRGKVKLFMTYNGGELEEFTSDNGLPHQELLRFDSNKNLVLKTTNTAVSRAEQSDALTSMHKHYQAGKITELQYPRESGIVNSTITPLTLVFSHDKSGHLISLGTRENPNKFASFTYTGSGSLLSESIEPGSEFEINRQFEYNTPGLLTKISDRFFAQQISFSETGYGQEGYGDGIVMSTYFNATWAKNSSMYDSKLYREWFSIPVRDYGNQEIMSMCLRALERLEILDVYYAIPQLFLGLAELSRLPLACGGSTGHKLMKLLGEKLPPIRGYGHSFSYGNYKELTKAKFYTDNDGPTNLKPLQVNTFSLELPSLGGDTALSERIWDALTDNGFIIVDNARPEDKSSAIGKGNKSIFCKDKLNSDLETIDVLAGTYTHSIIHLVFDLISQNEPMINLPDFQEAYITWIGYTDSPSTPIVIINKAKQDAQKIYEMLGEKGYISGDINSILHTNFIEAMASFDDYITEIATVLRKHFITQLGQSINDYEAVTVDPNGNHKLYYVGLNRHKLEYSENTNKVTSLTVQDPFAPEGEDLTVFELEHNAQGNVCKALHRNIDLIRYHPVSNRPVFMLLSDGRKIIFQYDSQGERILKRVYDSADILLSEVTYLRDETGRVIRDIRTKFGEVETSITTTYIYGPRGLLGFIRGETFFAVFSDHAGSIRLITQNGKVQAVYDYWPYGAPMREFGSDGTHIYYRFTGQEYDEETGLYNFHARMYDPLLGRFYQPDPKSQYSSPYLYSGNSPVSMVDPDGELAISTMVAMVILAIIGAYLAAAAANNSWNFTKWDWTDYETYFALAAGAATGLAMPGAFAALAAAGGMGAGAAFAVGLVGSAVFTVIEYGWNPLTWDWSRPGIYNSFFKGFQNGLKSITSPASLAFVLAGKELVTLLMTGQLDVLAKKLVNGIGNAYLEGLKVNGNNLNFLEWDWNDVGTWKALRDGYLSGSNAPIGYVEYLKSFLEIIYGITSDRQIGGMSMVVKIGMQDKSILRDKNHPFFNSFGESLLGQLKEYSGMGKIPGDSGVIKLDKMVLSTFEGVLNGMMEEPGLLKMVNEFRTGTLNLPRDQLFERLSFQEGMLHNAFNRFNRGISQLSKFYFETSLPDPEYESEVKTLISGLDAGGSVHLESGILKNFVDCIGVNSTLNIEKCDISSSTGRKTLQNMEMIHQIFRQSKKHESMDGFLLIEAPSQPSYDLLDNLFLVLKELPGNTDAQFLYDFFVGATFYSLLSPNHDIFIKKEKLPQGFEVLHLALLKNGVFFVRTVVIGSKADFEDPTTGAQYLVNYQSSQKFKCQVELPADRKKIEYIRGEMIFIQTRKLAKRHPDLFSHTPNLAVECKVESDPKFFKKINRLPPTGGEKVFQDFEAYSLGTINEEQKFDLFKQFVRGAMIIYEGMKSYLDEAVDVKHLFTGFVVGMIQANLRYTFDLQFVYQSKSKIVFVARDNGYGVDNWDATPTIINFNSDDDIENDSSHQIYPLSSFTLAEKAMSTDINQATLSIAYSLIALPAWNGFWTQNENIGENLIQMLKYLYYTISQYESQSENVEENKHFVSNSILGEFLSGDPGMKYFVFTGKAENANGRLKAQRLFLVCEEETGNATIFNVIESSKKIETGDGFEFDSSVHSDIPSLPSSLQISNLTEIKINLNINSQACWHYEENVSMYNAESCFFQGIENRLVENFTDIPRKNTYLQIEGVDLAPRGFLSFGQNHIKKLFAMLAADDFKPFVKTDVDLNSLITAYLFGVERAQHSDNDGLKLRVRKKVSSTIFPVEHSLLSVTQLGEVVPGSEQVLLENVVPISGGNVSKSLQEAKEELKAYYCSQPERFSEFLRVTDVPVVYGPQLRFEVEPDFLYQPNCSSNNSNFYLNAHKKSPFPTTSASSGLSPGISPIRILNYFKSSISNFIFGRPKTSGNDKSSHESSQNCQQGAWLDGSYNMDGLTCYTSESKVLVFPSIEPADIISQEKTGFQPQLLPLLGDNYLKSGCKPIEFNGRSSVSCKGKRSTFVYTPFNQERLFDNIDGNIMLGRIFLHLGAKVGGHGKFEGSIETTNDESFNFEITKENILGWQKLLTKIKILLADHIGNDNLTWAYPLVEDCKEMLVEIENKFARLKALGKPYRLSFELGEFVERLHSLKVDVEEVLEQASGGDHNVSSRNYEFEENYDRHAGFSSNVKHNVMFQNKIGNLAQSNAMN